MGRATNPAARPVQEIVTALDAARQRTLRLIAGLSEAQLETVHSTLMSPLVWDLGHIAAFEDLWLVHRYAGEPLLAPELIDVYDAFETPRADRGELPFLRTDDALAYMDAVRERALTALKRCGGGDGCVHELVIRHELQHQETMQQTLALARIAGGSLPAAQPVAEPGPDRWIAVPAGEFEIGAQASGFAYDNERPRFRVELAKFEIATVPVSNGEYREFMASTGAPPPGGWTAELDREWRAGELVELDPDAPVMHVSCDEAEAYAVFAGARLPTEFEWERAASGGALRRTGEVWEWTASCFNGYPGFSAYPYPEYSEVFFGTRYRVLRGGSWASSPRVATTTFRNWDLPSRRQIFAGVRIARDR